MSKNSKIGPNVKFEIVIGHYDQIFLIFFLSFIFLARQYRKTIFFQRVYLYTWAVAGHEL